MLPEPVSPGDDAGADAQSSDREFAMGPEATLVAQIRLGDEAAFERLFREYYEPLCAFATSYVRDAELAEELVEAVFARIWQQRERWHVATNLRAYLYTAVRYQVLDHRRRRAAEGRMHERSAIESISLGAAPVVDPHAQYELSELEAALQQAIDRLPERCRLVFTLRWQHHLGYADIATALGIGVKTVETQMNRALKAIRARLHSFR